MGEEARERAKRMARYGQELCFTCGSVTEESPRETIAEEIFDPGVFLQAETVISRGVPTPRPDKVLFCTKFCKQTHDEAMDIVLRAKEMLSGQHLTPAFRINLRMHLGKTMSSTEKPNV